MNTLIPRVGAGVFVLAGVGAVLYETRNSDNLGDLLSSKITDPSLTSKTKRRPDWNVCNVFWAESERSFNSVSRTASNRLTKIIEDFWTEEEFLKKIEKENLPNKEELKNKIKEGCSKNNKKAFIKYDTWRDPKDEKKWAKTWIYEEQENDGRNWLESKDVDVPENLKPESLTS
ncbi:hypothetical protein MHC_00815 [Mycoplasma haemocanis str. Illinois]|uniref:Uncharacterized protein n=1 Tax=Mycoplasma haemocanis (strain Illinois) TaxID=1111676 RepID=H6N5R9_MYCHN|nr:hypothetical protein [Mycoplasma haemocanis]AEW45029.1 hypothetical protein MHC_00815 [Mycoplasma haemocanis str. Illinois]